MDEPQEAWAYPAGSSRTGRRARPPPSLLPPLSVSPASSQYNTRFQRKLSPYQDFQIKVSPYQDALQQLPTPGGSSFQSWLLELTARTLKIAHLIVWQIFVRCTWKIAHLKELVHQDNLADGSLTNICQMWKRHLATSNLTHSVLPLIEAALKGFTISNCHEEQGQSDTT